MNSQNTNQVQDDKCNEGFLNADENVTITRLEYETLKNKVSYSIRILEAVMCFILPDSCQKMVHNAIVKLKSGD